MYGWVLPGGGANGAYQAGYMSVLAERGPMPEFIVGTSVGALNGFKAAEFQPHEGKLLSKALKDLWWGIAGNQDIYTEWYCGVFPAPLPFFLGWKPSIYCTKPLQEKVRGESSVERVRESGIKFVAVAVEWTSRSMVRTWDQDSDDIVEAVLASASYPVFFEPIQIGDCFYTDGGAREISPLKTAIEMGATKIDVIPTGVDMLPSVEGMPGGLDQIKRFADIVLDEVDQSDYRLAEHVNARVKCGCDVDPSWKLVEMTVSRPQIQLGDSLDFSPAKNRNLWDYGRACALARLGGE